MAETMKFGPEWLREGMNIGSTPPSSPGFGKCKLAEHRYGREEMLALFVRTCKTPDDLKQFSSIVVEKAQEPLAYKPLTVEEQRLMSQSVNSLAVLRLTGRGGISSRGARGGGERGRGRGRGRGEGFGQRGLYVDDDGGLGDADFYGNHLNRNDSWDDSNKRYERSFSARNFDGGMPHREYTRSFSNENWRERNKDEDGDWRKAGPRERWSSRGSWRDSSRGLDTDRGKATSIFYKDRPTFDRDRDRVRHQYQRSRSSESWDESDMPEWSVPGDEDYIEPGTFDSNGIFVTRKDTTKDGTEGHSKSHVKEKKDVYDNNEEAWETHTENKADIWDAGPTEDGDTPPKSPKSDELYKENNNSLTAGQETKQRTRVSSDVNSVQKPVRREPLNTASSTPPGRDSATDVKNSNSNNISYVDKLHKDPTNTGAISGKDALDYLQKTAENVIAEVTEVESEVENVQDNSAVSASDSEHVASSPWFYRDPQGEEQGPFTAEEMADWFSAGYFTMKLLVKRSCDDYYQPLGELIKRWGKVPFLSGLSPPPFKNQPDVAVSELTTSQPSPPPQQQPPPSQHQLAYLQQMLFQRQQQMLQQHWLRHIQLQEEMRQKQEVSENKSSPIPDQQMMMQLLNKHYQQILLQPHHLQHQSQQSPSANSPQSESVNSNQQQPAFHRSFSQPTDSAQQPESIWGSAGSGNWSQPSSVWDLGPNQKSQTTTIPATVDEQTDKMQKEQEELERKRKEQQLQQLDEELRKKKEEIKRQNEELERQRQSELQRKEEEKIKEELRRKQELQMQKELELEKQRQLELQRQQEELQRQQEVQRQKEKELQRQKEKEKQQELQRQRELEKQQELQRQRETERQQELEQQQQQELERELQREIQWQQQQQQQELDRELQREIQWQQQQQIEAEKLQRKKKAEKIQKQQEVIRKAKMNEQLSKIQLPAAAHWAKKNASAQNKTVSLAEIQQQEEMERQKEELQRKEAQQLQAMQNLQAQQQQQQQQQQTKIWANHKVQNEKFNAKSLLEIQQEQAKQLERERKKKMNQQQQAKSNLSLGISHPWGGTSPTATSTTSPTSGWSGDGAWGVPNKGSGSENQTTTKKKNSSNRNKQDANANSNFPSLSISSAASTLQNNTKSKSSKSRNMEDVVLKLFQSNKPDDDFTLWCVSALKSFSTSVDITTFVSYLKEVESPYEVHDYVRSFLGESKASTDFARQFLEKQNQLKNKGSSKQKQQATTVVSLKTAMPQEEESIWGPIGSNSARDLRPAASQPAEPENNHKGKGKGKKKKMQKIDQSILGFTVHAASDRFNIGKIDDLNK